MTTQPNPWDDPELAVNDNFVKFDEIGDSVSGVIQRIGKHSFDDGKVVPQLLIVGDDGEEVTLTAGQIRLKAALAEQRPLAGDHLKVTLSTIEKRSGGKTLKHFDVVVTPAGSPAATPVAAAAPAVAQPAAAAPVDAAAALAALTPEQRAQLGLPAA